MQVSGALRASRPMLRPKFMSGTLGGALPFGLPILLGNYGNSTGRLANDFESCRKAALMEYTALEVVREDGLVGTDDWRNESYVFLSTGVGLWRDIVRSATAPVWGAGTNAVSYALHDIYPETKFIPDASPGAELPRDLPRMYRTYFQHPFRKGGTWGRPWLTPAQLRVRFLARNKAPAEIRFNPATGEDDSNPRSRWWYQMTFRQYHWQPGGYDMSSLKGKKLTAERFKQRKSEWWHRGPAFMSRSNGSFIPEYDKYLFWSQIGTDATIYRWPFTVKAFLRYTWTYYAIWLFSILCWMQFYVYHEYFRETTGQWHPSAGTFLQGSPYPMHMSEPWSMRMGKWFRQHTYHTLSANVAGM
eukprot:TRINITY_DN12168_c0_g1_i1.p1 TRINITY_DN12168_c0_g1~~TRINITY_DN12168_c0_g1_i1.p1  ORF type:complete len:359 (-),score=18.21 TRINITY_DN12168_c0_g1_i1:291-1367(-)